MSGSASGSQPAVAAVTVAAPPAAALSFVGSLVVGGMASCTAELASFPFDVLKTRMQVAGTERHAAAAANAPSGGTTARASTPGIWRTLRTAVSTQGLHSLYFGIRPALLRQATYGSMKVMLYDQLKVWMCGSASRATPSAAAPPPPPSFACALVSGALAGAIAQAICTPTDLVKVRMQTASRPYRGVWHAFTEVVRTERGGLRALWTGVWPTTQRATVVSLTTLPTYDLAKGWLLSDTVDAQLSRWITPAPIPTPSPSGLAPRKRVLGDSVAVHLLASFSSGCVSSYASQPFDVLKSRVMNQPVDPATGVGLWYRGTWHCAVTTVRAEGAGALWKGSVAQLARTAPWLVVFWLSYEQFKRAALAVPAARA